MKLSGLTGLRGLAALIVLFYHLNQHRNTVGLSEFSWDMYQFTEHLVFVVSLFFVFSGFFRSLSYWKSYGIEGASTPKFFPSLRDRYFRIAPVYYLALIISFLLVILWQGWSIEGLLRFLSGIFFLSWVSPETFFPVDINGPLWFIAYDMLGWMGVSLFMMGIIRIRKMYALIVAFIFGFVSLIVLHYFWISLPWQIGTGIAGVWFPTYNPFLFGLHFLSGALFGGVIEWLRRKNFGKSFYYDILSFVIFVSLISFLWQIRGEGDWEYSLPIGPYHFPYTMVAIGLLIISLPYSKYIGNIFDNRFLVFVALISYPLYVFQALIIAILRKYFFIEVQLGFYNWTFFSIITLIFSLGLAWIIHRYVEMHEWRKTKES